MLKDLKPRNVGLARAGKIRLGYMLRKCPKCKQPTKAKLLQCEYCQAKLSQPDRRETYPTSTSYFVLDDAPEVVEHYGEQPGTLNIIFPFDSIEENMPSSHKLYTSTSLACQGDGQQIIYAIDPQSGKPVVRDGIALIDFELSTPDRKKLEFIQGEVVPCPGYAHDRYSKCAACRPQTTLRFFVQEIPRFSTFEVVTGSLHNYMNLYEQMSYFAAPLSEGGMGVSLKGIPFRLSLVPQKISVPKVDKKGNPQGRQRVSKNLLSLEIDPLYMIRLNAVQRRLAAPERILGLPAPDEPEAVEDFDDQDDVIIFGPPADDGDTNGDDLPEEATPEPVAPGSPPSDNLPPVPLYDPPPPPDALDNEAWRPATPEAKQYAKEVQQQPPPANGATSQAANGDRPYSPQQLREKVRKFIEICQERGLYHDDGQPVPVKYHPFGDRTAQLVAAKMQEALADIPDTKPEEAYRRVLDWFFFDVQSASEMKAVEAAAIFRILFDCKPEEIGFKRPVLDVARRELREVYYEITEPIPF